MQSSVLQLRCADAGNRTASAEPVAIDVSPNYPPRVSLVVSPTSGVSPLPTRIQYRCDDDNGPEDITSSAVWVGLDTVRATQLDSTLVLERTTPIGAACQDAQGGRTTAGPTTVEVLQPSISQNATVTEYINIAYQALLENVDTAVREVFHNGTLIQTDTITAASYSDTLRAQPIGQYLLVLNANPAVPDTVLLLVPDYPPEPPDLSFLNLNLNENSSIALTLPRATDHNVEQSPVRYTSVTTVQGGVAASLGAPPDDSILTIRASAITGLYELGLDYAGATIPVSLSGTVLDLARITGQLQDVRTDAGASGEIRVYRTSDSTLLKTVLTDPLGNYEVQLDNPESDLLLQARVGSATDSGYVRTLRLAAADTSGFLIRAYPYPTELSANGIQRNAFLMHLRELNPQYQKTRVDSVEIIDVDPLGRGSFTQSYMELVRDKILNPNDIGCYLPGRILYVQIDSAGTAESQKHYRVRPSGDGQRVFPDSGWVLVTRDTTLGAGGVAGRLDDYRADILIKSQNGPLAAHEFGHVFTGMGHAVTLPETQTIMRAEAIQRSTPGPADCEAAFIVGEDTWPSAGCVECSQLWSDLLALGFLR